jgi:hypothetical protein
LALPFRLLFLAVLVLAGFAAWSYRREIKRQIHEWTADSGPPEVVGRAEVGSLANVRRRLDSLARRRADSVLLSASDVAGSVETIANRLVPGSIDSVTVRLDREDIDLRGRVDTRTVPVSLGPVRGVVRDHEFVEAGGRLVYRKPGIAEWQVERVRVRGVPVPRELAERLLRSFGATAELGALTVPLPPAVTGLRVTAAGIVMYGRGTAGAIQ